MTDYDRPPLQIVPPLAENDSHGDDLGSLLEHLRLEDAATVDLPRLEEPDVRNPLAVTAFVTEALNRDRYREQLLMEYLRRLGEDAIREVQTDKAERTSRQRIKQIGEGLMAQVDVNNPIVRPVAND